MTTSNRWYVLFIIGFTLIAFVLHYGSMVALVNTNNVATDHVQAPCPKTNIILKYENHNSTIRHLGAAHIVREDHVVYLVTAGLRALSPWIQGTRPGYDEDGMPEDMFFKFIEHPQIECEIRSRFGTWDDGGWEVCMAAPYTLHSNSCLVYSFGINDEWSFDDDISDRLGCDVRAFDPTMDVKKEHMRDANIHFYPLGLYGENTEIYIGDDQLPVRTLDTLIAQAGDSEKIIDYMKMDVESSEWDALPQMMTSDTLRKRVRQIGIETHSSRDKKQIQMHIALLQKLERIGFRRWHTHLNERQLYPSEHPQQYYSYGQELYYVNINFLSHTNIV